MKRSVILFLAIYLALALAACAEGDTLNQPVVETPAPVQTEEPVVPAEVDDPEQPFEGKIAIITPEPMQNYLIYSVYPLQAKYGDEKIISETWPIHHSIDVELMDAMFAKLEKDFDIKAIIANPLVWTGNPFFEKLLETREDIFVIYCDPSYNSYAESWKDIAQTADLVLKLDELSMGSAMVQQSQNLGAKTFVYYSFPREMSQPLNSKRRDLIRETCKELGLEFVEATAIDPISEVGIAGAYQFISEDVPKMVKKYGKDTAFFATFSYQSALLETVEGAGAISPQPSHPFHLLMAEIDYHIDYWLKKKIGRDYIWENPDTGEWWVDDTHSLIDVYNDFLIDYRRTKLAEKDMLGRMSNWPVDYEFMFTSIAAEYAIKWINGEVPKEGVDVSVLKQLMEDYAGVEVYLTPFVDDGTYDYDDSSEPTGETYDNFLLMRMDYITY